jgi:hypothetical protein
MVVTPSFTYLCITFSNQRFGSCSLTVDVGFVKLTSDSFCGNRVYKMNIELCCHLCCSSCVIFWNRSSQCMTVSFCQWWFSPTVPLHCCCPPMSHVCQHSLRNCRSQYIWYCAVFVMMFQVKVHQRYVCLLSTLDKSPIFGFFDTDYHSTQSPVHWQCWQLKFFQCSWYKQILVLSLLMFPLFYSLPICILHVSNGHKEKEDA